MRAAATLALTRSQLQDGVAVGLEAFKTTAF
jgi:hypothetical protein